MRIEVGLTGMRDGRNLRNPVISTEEAMVMVMTVLSLRAEGRPLAFRHI